MKPKVAKFGLSRKFRTGIIVQQLPELIEFSNFKLMVEHCDITISKECRDKN